MTDRIQDRVHRLECWADDLDEWLAEGADVLLEAAEQHEKTAGKTVLVIASLAFMLGLTVAFAMVSAVSVWRG